MDELLVILHIKTELMSQRPLSSVSDQEKESYAQFALNAAGLGTWNLDPLQSRVVWDQRCRELYGFAAGEDDIPFDQVLKYIHEDDAEKVTTAVAAALDASGSGNYDIRFRTIGANDHKLRWLHCKGKAYLNEDGVVWRFAGTAQDITEEALAQEEQRKLRTLIDNSVDLMSLLGMDGRNTYINKAGRKLLGIDEEEDVSLLPISDLHTEEQLAFVEKEIIGGVMKHGSWSGRFSARNKKTGEHIPLINNCIRIDDPETGKPIAIGAVMRDLRPEIEAIRALQESESRFRDFVMASPTPIGVYLGREMKIYLANQAILNAWGRDNSVVGKTYYEVLTELETQPYFEILDNVFTTGEPYSATEDRVDLVVDGRLQTFYFNFSFTPLKKDNGEVYGVMNTATDVTSLVRARLELKETQDRLLIAIDARKKIELGLEEQVQERTEELQATTEELQSTNEELSATNEELQEANVLLYRSNNELEQFAYVASHDLQEPLRKIRLYSGMLQTLYSMPQEAMPTLAKVVHSAERMSSLIKDLLEFSRLMKVEKRMRKIPLDQVLGNVINDYELLIAEKEAQVSAEVLPSIEAESLQMNQLFYNLLGNALKFSRKNVPPVINITTKLLSAQEVARYGDLKESVRYYEIIFADNGIGFDNKYAEQIFEVFKRLHTREDYPGSGIGLALCRRIVQNHGGVLFASSEENKGTLIYLVLPENQ